MVLDTRKNLGTSASTKWILPVEGTGLAKEVSTRFQKKNTCAPALTALLTFDSSSS
jgi:hypothetical protein